MSQTRLSLKSIGDLDEGAAAIVIDNAINAAVNDLDDRGRDGKPREVRVVIRMTQDESGYVHNEVEACAVVPKFRTRDTIGKISRREGEVQVLFQEFAGDDPDQSTLPKLKKE